MVRRLLDGLVGLMVLIGVIYIARNWFRAGATGQDRVMLAGLGLALAGIVAFWLASYLPGAWKWGAYGLMTLVGLLAATSLEIAGVTGDLVPILKFRWGGGAARPALLAEGSAVGTTADFPQFLGPDRDARLSGPKLAGDWQATPPREIWRIPVGEGWSSFAVSGQFAVTQEQHGGEERVVAYDWRTGELLWSHADLALYESTIGGVGPRATPTIDRGRVYTVGATGLLNAIELETGESLWQHDLVAEYEALVLDWGNSASPLVVEEQVVVSVGAKNDRSVVAFDTVGGTFAWGRGAARSSYSSPNVIRLAGVEQLVVFHQDGVRGYSLDGSQELWQFPWSRQQPNVAQPVKISDNRLLVSSGYGVGAKAIELSLNAGVWSAALVWESPRMKAKFTNVVLHQGSVYGLDDGVLVCLDPETGERRWKKGRYGDGQLLLVGEDLLIVTEDGELVIGEASPVDWVERATVEVFDRKTWNPPALFGPYLLLRNNREAVLMELPTEG